MHKIHLFISMIIIIFSHSISYSQNKYLTVEDSDKEAIKLLKDTKNLLNNSTSLSFDYSYTSISKDDAPIMINGIGKQKSDKFYIEMGDQTMYCDGKDLIVFFNTQNEAQINDYDTSESNITPTSILNTFNDKDFIFVMLPTKRIKNRSYSHLLLKPVDKYSDYIKVEGLFDKITGLPFKIEMYMKDGTKNILEINSLKLNQKVDDSVFIFDKAKHPGVVVEDLRMN